MEEAHGRRKKEVTRLPLLLICICFYLWNKGAKFCAETSMEQVIQDGASRMQVPQEAMKGFQIDIGNSPP